MKKLLCMVVAVLAGTVFAENVLRGDFLLDNFGGFVDWTTQGKISAQRLAEKGPGGQPVMRLTGEHGAFVHSTLELAKDEDFRMSFWVRTKGVRDLRLEFLDLRARFWLEKYPLPIDTKGEWKKLEWSFKLGHSHDNYYVWRLIMARFDKDGFVDICDPQLEPVSEQAKAKTHKRSTNQPYKARITPIDPEVNRLNAANAKMTFHFSGAVADATEKYVLKAMLAGHVTTAAFDADKRATIAFGELADGAYEVGVRVVGEKSGRTIAENTYILRTAPAVANPTPLKKLNNFVSEIAAKPLANGETTFTFARDGWVYIGLDKPVKGVTAELDGAAVLAWDDGLYMETMRWVKAGSHTVKIAGVPSGVSARLNLRRVKYITASSALNWFHNTKPKPKFAGNTFGPAYMKRFGLDRGFNTVTMPAANKSIWKADTPQGKIRQDLLDRGVYISYGTKCFLETAPVRNIIEDYSDVLFNNEAGKHGLPCCFEENTVKAPRLMKYNAATLWWDANLRNQRVDMYYADMGRMQFFSDPDFDIPEMAGYANGGTGDAIMIHEAYYSAPGTRATLDNVYKTMKEQAAQMDKLVPIYVDHTISLCNTYMTLGSWTSWVEPECDYKGFLSRYIQLMATDPAFERMAGVGLPGVYCDEDFYRFARDAIRYYCIEGGTDDYGAKYGISDVPGFMDNGDFYDGFKGWTVHAAAKDSLETGKNAALFKFMRRHANRFTNPWCSGIYYAQLTKSNDGVNSLTRTIRGLKKGAYYQLVFGSFNQKEMDEKVKPQNVETAVKVTFSGATEVPEFTTIRGAGDSRFTKFKIATHRYVVRADAEEITFTLSDGEGLAAGDQRCINYVGFRPCYFKNPQDFDDLLQMYRDTLK